MNAKNKISFEYVPASSIWPSEKDHVDYGAKMPLVRGYNVEVKRVSDGLVDWLPAEWINFSPEECFFDDFHKMYYGDLGLEMTGRLCFRGYGYEEYDIEEHDTFISMISDEDISELFAEEIKRKEEACV